MTWELEPDAQALVHEWTSAKPGLRVIRIRAVDIERIEMELCEKKPAGWFVTTIDFDRRNWQDAGPELRAHMLHIAFDEAEAAWQHNPNKLRKTLDPDG